MTRLLRRRGGWLRETAKNAYHYANKTLKNTIARVQQRLGHIFVVHDGKKIPVRDLQFDPVTKTFTAKDNSGRYIKFSDYRFHFKKPTSPNTRSPSFLTKLYRLNDPGTELSETPELTLTVADRPERSPRSSLTTDKDLQFIKEKENFLQYIQSKLSKQGSYPYHGIYPKPNFKPGKIIVLKAQYPRWDYLSSINIGVSGERHVDPIWYINWVDARLVNKKDDEYALDFNYRWEYLEDISFQTKNTTLHLPAAEILEFLQTNTKDGVVQNQDELFKLLDFKESMKNVQKDVTAVRKALTHGNVPRELAPNVLSFLHPVKNIL